MKNKKFVTYWYERSKEETDDTNKFISLWISFNAFYNSSSADSEINRIEQACDGFIASFRDFTQLQRSCFKDFQKYITEKPDNSGFIQDMRYDLGSPKEEPRRKYYSDVNCLSEYLRVVYQIRCNLFHGNKINDNEQDKTLIKLAYVTLFKFFDLIVNGEK